MRRPTELSLGLGCVAEHVIHLCRTEKRGAGSNVLLPVEPNMIERDLDELADRVTHTGRDDVVVRAILLEHQPHRAHVIAGKAPVAMRLEVANGKLAGEPELDPGDAVRHLS